MPERVKANQAKDWLQAKVEGKKVYLKTYKDKEKFGRYLAEVFMEDPSGKETLEPSINQAMVVLNLGVEYFGGKR
jgi:endonuclease YncB( thermonuclease family)